SREKHSSQTQANSHSDYPPTASFDWYRTLLRVRVSFAIDSEGEQQVARLTNKAAASRVSVEHAIDDHRTAAIQSAALCLHAIDAIIRLSGGIEVPDNRSVFGGVGPKVSIRRAGKYDPRDECRGGRLRVIAPRSSPAALRGRRWYMPQALAGGNLESSQPWLAG